MNHPKCAELDRGPERDNGLMRWSVISEDLSSNLDILEWGKMS